MKQIRIFAFLLFVVTLLVSCNTDADIGQQPESTQHVCKFERITDDAYLVSVGNCHAPAIYQAVCKCGTFGEEYTMEGTFAHTDADGNFVCDTCKNLLGELNYNAVILEVKDGRNAIVTMTFDDGHYPTAEALNRLLEKYDLSASLMMVTKNVGDTEPWEFLLKNGRLDTQCHSYSHKVIAPPSYSAHNPNNNTPDVIQREIVDSKADMDQLFPEQDCLVFAIPNSITIPESEKAIMETYYAARSGLLGSVDKVQSLDPIASSEAGGWYNPYVVRFRYNTGVDKIENTVKYLDACVENGGWFISLCHGIVNSGGIHYDMSIEHAQELFAVLQSYSNDGKIWCATYGDAVKYIRERQNSTVTQYANENGIFVELTMSDMTEDSLPLPADVFDMPLTVKITVPNEWESITYTQGENSAVAETYTQNGQRYANVDLIPNGGVASITDANC